MKKNLIPILFLISASVMGQQKSFEGSIWYKTDVKSKSADISNRQMKRMFALGDSSITRIKRGYCRNTNDVCDEYYIASAKKVYLKFIGIDTLYYLDYSEDTSTVTGISKGEELQQIAGYSCKNITISTTSSKWKYQYAPSLYLDPAPDADNRIGRYDIFAKETSSVWLERTVERKTGDMITVCRRIQQEPVADSVFRLPDLPQRKFVYDAIITPATFKGSGGWLRYLQTHLLADLGARYIKMSRKEKRAEQSVMVKFTITENGRISNIEVLNMKEVHPKLAEEAVRVISESPAWQPATIFGEKIKYQFTQPVTFTVIKD